MRQGGLFEGYGGLSMAVAEVLGAELAWYSEHEPPTKSNPKPTQAAARLLAYRHPSVPNLGDITAIDWAAVTPVDVLTGGFPCQDVSLAGKRRGIRPDSRSGLWTHMAYAIDQLRPSLVVIENVRGLLSADAACDLEPCPWCLGDDEGRPLRALGAVLGDLAELGYDARWCGLRAADVGAPHGRFRVFVAAWPAADTASVGRGEGRSESARLVGGPDAAGGGDAVQDADGAARRERGLAAPGPAEGGRARPDAGGRGGVPAADAEDDRRAPFQPCGHEPEGPWATGRWSAAPDADARGRERAPHAGRGPVDGAPAAGSGDVAWGDYEPAIRRWELILGRSAPAPTQTGRGGGQQLSPRFVEWLMGLPEGHVTAVPGLTRNEQLGRLGNGVVPQQAAAALRYLLGAVAGAEPASAEAS